METTDSTIQFFKELIGVSSPWMITAVLKNEKEQIITIRIEHKPDKLIACPLCNQSSKRYDLRKRELRYLDTCDYKTILEVHVPRIKCKEDGVQQIQIPFAEKSSRFAMKFEMKVIEWLKDICISKVAENLNMSWDQVDGIMQRAVKRGLTRLEKTKIYNLGIDETSYQKHHEYITIILDKDRDCIIGILDDRKAETLENWFKTQQNYDFSQLKSISMDMWDPYILAVRNSIYKAEEKISFDRYHVSSLINKAVDAVRRREHQLLKNMTGGSPLSKSRFQWLTNSNRTDNRTGKRRAFLILSRLNLITARAWRIKETANSLWDYMYMNVAKEAWKKLLLWISHSRIPEMIKAGKTIRYYFWGILNTIRLKASNGMAEAKNNCIQRIKRMACGFRNRDRFRTAIMFHLGKLDMSPSTL